jgi:hypothetical protein
MCEPVEAGKRDTPIQAKKRANESTPLAALLSDTMSNFEFFNISEKSIYFDLTLNPPMSPLRSSQNERAMYV